MRTKDVWEFQTIGRGLKELNVNGESYVAHGDGVLDFLPYELEMVEWPPHPNGKQNMEYVYMYVHTHNMQSLTKFSMRRTGITQRQRAAASGLREGFYATHWSIQGWA
jgi:hypothetical protein